MNNELNFDVQQFEHNKLVAWPPSNYTEKTKCKKYSRNSRITEDLYGYFDYLQQPNNFWTVSTLS